MNSNGISITLGDGWRAYRPIIPRNSRVIGTIAVCGDTGALVQIETTGLYVISDSASVRFLDQDSVRAALAKLRDRT